MVVRRAALPALFIKFPLLFAFQRAAFQLVPNATFFFGLISKYEKEEGEKINSSGYEVGQTVSG